MSCYGGTMNQCGGGQSCWRVAEACEQSCALKSSFLTNCLNPELKSLAILKAVNDFVQVARVDYPWGQTAQQALGRLRNGRAAGRRQAC